MSLDDRVDELYALPLNQFVAARTALAKTVSGDAAKQVKALPKPTVLPWAVNQVYWHARPIYDALLKAGAALRRAQIASLEGRQSDVRGLTAAHRAALNAAVKEAVAIGAREEARPAADALARLFEAVSLNESADEPHGRLTRAIVPAGFEALLGVAVKAPVRSGTPAPGPSVLPKKPGDHGKQEAAKLAALEKQRADAERRRQQAIARAEQAVAAAKADEQDARRLWEAAEERLAAARQSLEALRERQP